MSITSELFPEFDEVLADMGLDAEKIRKEKCILSGRTISEYVLYRKGILKSFSPNEITLYENMYSGNYHPSFQSKNEFEEQRYEEFELCFEKNLIPSPNDLYSYYPRWFVEDNTILNLERIYYFNGSFFYREDFQLLLETKIIKTVFYYKDYIWNCNELDFSVWDRIYSVLKTYETLPKELYLNPEIELKRIIVFAWGYSSVDFSYAPEIYAYFLKYESLLQKYFEIKKSGTILELKPLKTRNELAYFQIPKDEKINFYGVYFDYLYGNASKLDRLNFQSIYRIAPEIFSIYVDCPCCVVNTFALKDKQLSNSTKQLSYNEIRNLKELILDHGFGGTFEDVSMENILRIHRIIKKLENEFGTEVWRFVYEDSKFSLLRSTIRKKFDAYQEELRQINSNIEEPKNPRERSDFEKPRIAKDRSYIEELRKVRDISDFQNEVKKEMLTIKELFTANELQKEGKKMKHSLGGYYRNVWNQTSRIFHLSHGQDVSTLELAKSYNGTWRIVQNRGKRNSEAVEILKDLANRFVEYLKEKEDV